MYQIRIFIDSNEDFINKWLSKNKNFVPTRVETKEQSDHYDNGDICNTWVETIVIYRVEEKK